MLPAGLACTAGQNNFAEWAAAKELADDAKQVASRPAKTGESSAAVPPRDRAGVANQAALVQAAVSAARRPDARSLSEALGIDISRAKGGSIDWTTNSLQELGDLDGDGIAEFALNRVPAASLGAPTETCEEDSESWELFLLAWDGAQWRASLLEAGFEPYELRVVSSLTAGAGQLALTVYAGAAAVPYPAIFQVKDHAASLLWDGRSEESRYQGYPQGKIDFRVAEAGGAPQMMVSGRADPGLLHFAKGGRRGFDVQAVYAWNGKAYVPKKTEYSPNQDYQLYQLISALHLHNFRSAYALIDPAKFLKTDLPSLDAFRQLMQNSWPEFLDDQIFEARAPASNAADDFAFELTREDKHYVYYPSFSGDSKHLLTGLDRREDLSSDH